MSWIKKIGKVLGVLLLLMVLFLASMYRRDISPEEVNANYLTPESQFIEVGGIQVHVRIIGDGEPIFLLHGSFASLHTWEQWQQELSPYYQTISLDFPGHGLTGPDSLKRYSTMDYSQLVHALAQKLNLPKYHLAGNSMGGGVALQLASDHPEQVLSLNLIDAAGAAAPQKKPADSSAQKKASSGGAWIFQVARHPIFSKLLLSCTPKFLFALNMKQVYGDDTKVTDEVTTRYYELMLREGNRQATLDRLSMPRKGNGIQFERLTMPTLILWGEKDNLISVENARQFNQDIRGSLLEIYPNVGHVPMEEVPGSVSRSILSFVLNK